VSHVVLLQDGVHDVRVASCQPLPPAPHVGAPAVAAAIASNHTPPTTRCLGGVGEGHLDLDGGVDGDGGHLLDDLRGGVQVDDALVDAQLEAVPGLGTLTARRLAGRDAQHLRGQADGAGHLALQALLLGTALQGRADCSGDGEHVGASSGGAFADWWACVTTERAMPGSLCSANTQHSRHPRAPARRQLTLLQRLDVAGRQGDADAVRLDLLAGQLLALNEIGHLDDGTKVLRSSRGDWMNQTL